MVASSVRELGRSDVDDTLTGTFRDLMNESHEVLVGVTEAHSAADSALEERSRTGHVECHHTLVLVPYVDHPVELLLRALDRIYVKQTIPVCIEFREGRINFRGSIE